MAFFISDFSGAQKAAFREWGVGKRVKQVNWGTEGKQIVITIDQLLVDFLRFAFWTKMMGWTLDHSGTPPDMLLLFPPPEKKDPEIIETMDFYICTNVLSSQCVLLCSVILYGCDSIKIPPCLCKWFTILSKLVRTIYSLMSCLRFLFQLSAKLQQQMLQLHCQVKILQ